MTIRIYGDITLDNYEYEHPGNFTEAYEKGLDLNEHPYPKLSGRIRNRFVVRKFGGAHLLARYVAIAMTVWNKGEPDDQEELDANITDKSLNHLRPWAEYGNDLYALQEKLVKSPTEFENVLNLFYRVSKDPDKAYRMLPGGYEGYTLPMRKYRDDELFGCLLGAGKSGATPRRSFDQPIEIKDAYEQFTLCLFNDGGTRLRYEDPAWLRSEPWAEAPHNKRTWAVVKSHEPVLDSDKDAEIKSRFFRELFSLLSGRLIMIINADDLRRHGIAISRSLSWEQSVQDTINHLTEKPASNLLPLIPKHVVITFDYDAALYLRTSAVDNRISVEKTILVFSTSRSEGEYQSGFEGSMPGAQSVFTSVFAGLIHTYFAEHPMEKQADAAKMLDDNEILIEKILTYALIAKQQMLQCGFEAITKENMFIRYNGEINDRPALWLAPNLMYHEAVFALPPARQASAKGAVGEYDPGPPMALRPSASKPDRFSYPLGREKETSAVEQLRKDQATYGLSGISLGTDLLARDREIFDVLSEDLGMEAFVEYVQKGKIKCSKSAAHLPVATIGKIKTISSREIESLRAIRRLIQSYLAESNTSSTPLGLAVFGPPGSGKSFTVKSVFRTLRGRSKDLIEGSFIECNLSGLSGPEDISHVFQTARDFRLRGKVPVMFFDEFDCSVGAVDFFWLKHFLAPLQDGEFTSGQRTHPIGKSIFVFAGGSPIRMRSSRPSSREPIKVAPNSKNARRRIFPDPVTKVGSWPRRKGVTF